MSEAAARKAILERFVEAIEKDEESPSLEECVLIASSAGAPAPEAAGFTYMREALLIQIGVDWGVGPEARWRDKVRVSIWIWWDTLARRLGRR